MAPGARVTGGGGASGLLPCSPPASARPRDADADFAAAMGMSEGDGGRSGEAASRMVKRVKIDASSSSSSSSPGRLEHPLGVKPVGNFFEEAARGVRECRGAGLGGLARLPDFQLLALLNFLAAADLARLSQCSRAAYVVGYHDELWRVLVLEEMQGAFEARKTWRQAYVATRFPRWEPAVAPAARVKVRGFYSDLLFQSFYCAAAPIEDVWLAVENIERRSAKQLTLEAFRRDFERPNVPVILTDAIDDWPALHKWTDEYLADVSQGQTFVAGGFELPMDRYLQYSRTLLDDQPLFIFDKQFVAKVPQLGADYAVPEYFREDLFSLLGPDRRPDYRWLIIGPKKSGSSFHVDPNATNAWNAVLRGAKKWIMFPPEVVPPGVHPSEDGGDVSTPVSLLEWFVTFYKQVRRLPAHQQPLEGVCRQGETMFVPHGWWHLVLNIDESVAITQNFVSAGNLKSVLRFLRDKPDQVSGLPMDERHKLRQRFLDALEAAQPETKARVERELQDEYDRKHRKSKWEQLVHGDAAEAAAGSEPGGSSANSFGFGFQF